MSVIQIRQLPLEKIVNGCAKESLRFRAGQAGEDGYCIEILRRAIDQNNQDAWEAFYQQYKGLIARWVGNGPNTEDLLQVVFEKFFKMVKAKKFVLNENIGEVLYYLKRCSISVRLNHLREEKKQNIKESLQDLDASSLENRSSEDLVESYPLSTKNNNLDEIFEFKDLLKDLISWFNNHLQNDQERQVVTLSFEFGLTPQEIAEEYKNQFVNVAEVRRIKERILIRLRRSEEYQNLIKSW